VSGHFPRFVPRRVAGSCRARSKVVPKVVIVAMVIGAALAGAARLAGGRVAAAALDPAADAADKAFLDAAQKGDAAGIAKVLDANFAWISANGKTLNRADTLKALPKPSIADEHSADLARFSYGAAVEDVEINSGKMHELRILVKRPEGWRVLVYQEVRSLDAPLSFTPGAGSNCQNPCKSIPFTPQSATQRDVANAYMAVEASAVAQDAEVWSSHTAYEFVGATSNGVAPMDKATRVAQLEKKSMGGLAPTPLVSAEMYEFPGAVVMRSKHRPDRGQPLEVTRLWTQRGGGWVLALSYQTAVQ
jgi:hypothetical protein